MTLHDDRIYDGIEKMGLTLDLQGWHWDHPIFKQLVDELEPHVMIEVGTWKGGSAIRMASHARDTEIRWKHVPTVFGCPHIFCVDTWLGSREIWANKLLAEKTPRLHGFPQVYFQFLHNVNACGLRHRVTPLAMTSKDGAMLLRAAAVRAKLIYVDASHDYSDVYWDLRFYWDLLEQGGVMFGDDYAGFPGVTLAVDEFAEKSNVQLEIIGGLFWVLRKK